MGQGNPANKILLINHCSPGDVLMLTAAVRDLHRAYPGQYVTGVDTYCPDLWQHNPYVRALDANDPQVLRVDCNHPPLLDRCNGQPRHYVESMNHLLWQTLGRDVPLSRFAPDLHLSDEEMTVPPVGGPDGAELPRPYWLLVAGGKRDLTTKWWPTAYWQQVVDHFDGRVGFVQAGAASDHHPPLRGVTSVVGRTSLREFVRLVYHAEGVVCPVTAAMHIAAAFDKPCVVPAGGREPPHWEMYPSHQFLHTVGQLPCCADRGCWKARVVPLGDGDADRDRNLCLRPVRQEDQDVAECMAMIEPADVCRAIDRYRRHPRAPAGSAGAGDDGYILTETNARAAFDAAARSVRPYPGGFEGRGVVIPGGGTKYFPSAFVCVRILRQLGCELPIEVWHLGPAEMTSAMRGLLEPMGVRCVDALEVRRQHPARVLQGWELKAYAILHTRFREVLLLDADNVPVVDPSYLFETPQFREHGAIFWPDFLRFGPERDAWRLTGVPYRDEPEFESGQVVVDKRRCWGPVQLAMWINEHSDFWYRFLYGDKDTFRFAWHKLGRAYAMPSKMLEDLDSTVMLQFDFDGRRLFQHRNRDKWKAGGAPQRRVPDFWLEDDCLRHLDDLNRLWTQRPVLRYDHGLARPDERRAAEDLCGRRWTYRRVGYDERPMAFALDGSVTDGAADCERTWNLSADADGVGDGLVLTLCGQDRVTCTLTSAAPGRWQGRWQYHERMAVELLVTGD